MVSDLQRFPFSSRSFGRELRWTRELYSVSQYRLGRWIGVSQTTISNWEHELHEPSPAEVFALEQALHQSPGAFSRLLGYVPLDDHTQLAFDLLTFVRSSGALELMRRVLADQPEKLIDDLGLAG